MRVFDPSGLPMKDDTSEKHPRVVELRDLSTWSEGQVWVCPVSAWLRPHTHLIPTCWPVWWHAERVCMCDIFPQEQHGTITAVFKNQIDWIPLAIGSVRPTQGRTLAVAQVGCHKESE